MRGFTPLEIFNMNWRDNLLFHWRKFKFFQKSGNQKFLTGFTLVETIIVVAIFGLVMGAVMTSILMLYRAQNYNFEQAAAINEARRGIETMVKGIREAKTGEDGSYIIEKADDNEFIFYSDIDQDNSIERVRYFLGGSSGKTQTKECVTFLSGGSCSVNFINFFQGTLESASAKISVEGDFGASNEYADNFADAISLGRVCQNGCNDCPSVWQGSLTFDVFSQAGDNNLTLMADASSRVNNICNWIEPNHSMKTQFELSWQENIPGGTTIFYKGVTEPEGWPVRYLVENEQISALSQYVRNTNPIFRYFNKDGQEIISLPARPEETTLMRVYLKINVDPNRAPEDFELESDAQLRNLKTNL